MANLKFRWLRVCFLLLGLCLSSVSASGDACKETLPELFNRVSKAVVQVSTVKMEPSILTDRISSTQGSGFLIHKDGLVLTNAHVVFGTQAQFVTLDDGTLIPAAMVGIDPILDLAILKVEPRQKPLPVVAFSQASLPQVGEEVIAIGNPLGLEQTLTRGVVSGINRTLSISPMSQTIPMIQTDAAINPGNSGGPLLNRCGEVIGINTLTLMGAENMGFALPAAIIQKALSDLVKNGRIIRPWIGIRGKLVDKSALQEILNIDLRNGFLVEMIEPGSPAEKAGLQGGLVPVKFFGEEYLLGGDIIVTANGKKLQNRKNFQEFVDGLKIDDKVSLGVYRSGKLETVDLKVIERPLLPCDIAFEN